MITLINHLQMDQYQFVDAIRKTKDYDPDDSYEKAHFPLPEGMGDEKILLHHFDHQIQGIFQSEEVGRRCFFPGDAKKVLNAPGYFPPGWFEAWDLFDKWMTLSSRVTGRKAVDVQIEKKIGIWGASVAQRKEWSGRCAGHLNLTKRGKELAEFNRENGGFAKATAASLVVLRRPVQITFLESGEMIEFECVGDAENFWSFLGGGTPSFRRAVKSEDGVVTHTKKKLNKKFKIRKL
jgi:hypothetical protein